MSKITMDDIYEKVDEIEKTRFEFKQRSDLKKIYGDFFHDFRDYLTEFVRENIGELLISEMKITAEPTALSVGDKSGTYVTLKNQGDVECYVATSAKGGFRLDPGEKEKIWMNKGITVCTVSGNTTLGIIRT